MKGNMFKKVMQRDRQTDRQTQTDRQRQTDRLRHTERHTESIPLAQWKK